jgi:recombination protein RecA
MFGSGVSRMGDLIDLAVAKNIVQKTGAWFAYNEERLGQGRENAKEFLEQNPELAAKIEREMLAAYGVKPAGAAEEVVATAGLSSSEPLAAVGGAARAGAVALSKGKDEDAQKTAGAALSGRSGAAGGRKAESGRK